MAAVSRCAPAALLADTIPTHHGTVSEEQESSEKAYLRWDCGNPLCAECGLAFAAKTELDQHTKEAHDGENHYDDHRPECENCGSHFSNEYLMRCHQEMSCKQSRTTAEVFYKFQCPRKTCDRVFESYISMDYHHRTAHTREEEVLDIAVLEGLLTDDNKPPPPALSSATWGWKNVETALGRMQHNGHRRR
jgi:hypothetical protein